MHTKHICISPWAGHRVFQRQTWQHVRYPLAFMQKKLYFLTFKNVVHNANRLALTKDPVGVCSRGRRVYGQVVIEFLSIICKNFRFQSLKVTNLVLGIDLFYVFPFLYVYGQAAGICCSSYFFLNRHIFPALGTFFLNSESAHCECLRTHNTTRDKVQKYANPSVRVQHRPS